MSQVRSFKSIMMKRETIPIADIYVPTKRRATLEQKRVDEIAASILDKGLLSPILVRADGMRFVLVEGLHRLEAAKALGEETIVAFLVDARKHWRRHLLFRRDLAAAKARGKRLRRTRWHRESHAPSSVVSGPMDTD